MEKSEDLFFDEWEDAMLRQLIQAEELALSAISKPTQNQTHHPQPPKHSATTAFDPTGFSPPRELSQRPTTDFDSLSLPLHHHRSPPRPSKPPPPSSSSSTFAPAFPRPDSDKDQEIERLKKELGHASKKLADLEKECLELNKDRGKKEDQLKFISHKNEEENARTKVIINEDHNSRVSGILGPDYHKISSFQNGVSSKDPSVEKTFKSKGVETDTVSHQEAQGSLSDDLPAYLNLSQKLLGVWESPIDKRLGSNAISKLLVCCQRDFHILFGFMSMSLPSEITRKLLTDISSSGRALHYLKDCFRTPEAAKVSHLYLVLTKINDGTDVLETMIEPLLDLCGMENVVIVHSSLCILHSLLKFLLETENNFGRSALCSGTMSTLNAYALGRTLWILVNQKVLKMESSSMQKY